MNRRLLISLLFSSAAMTLAGASARAEVKVQKPKAAAKAPPKRAVVVLDPGHGGRDPGAIGARGTMEKNVTLALAREVKAQLAMRPDLVVSMTRDSDVLLPLSERVAIGQSRDADLFVSLHADATPTPRARGLSVYTLSEDASDDLASALAERENKVDVLYGVDLNHMDKDVADVLIDLARRRSHAASTTAKRRLIKGVSGKIKLLENPMRSANFAVLRSPQVPSILIESGFLSNPEDEKLLADPKFRTKLAQMLAGQIADIALDLRAG
jgi:N-acetylmuramoyl-L-alanine amidase